MNGLIWRIRSSISSVGFGHKIRKMTNCSLKEWDYYVACVDDDGIDDTFPYECAREFALPGPGFEAGYANTNERVLKLMYGAKGTDVDRVCRSHRHASREFFCPYQEWVSPSHSYWEIDHYHCDHYSKPGFVTRTFTCNCLRDEKYVESCWTDLMEVKYETKYLAGAAVAWFFVRKLNYFPKAMWDTEVGPDYGTVVLSYHSSSSEDIDQNLVLHVKYKEGGWHISNPLAKTAKKCKRSCCCCTHSNCFDEYRVMFGLDCGSHYVCEFCVFDFFTSYPQWKANDENKGGIEVRHPSTCNACAKDKMKRVVHMIGFDSVKVLRAPRPCGYIGRKPIFNRAFFRTANEFFERQLKWVTDSIYEAEREVTELRKLVCITSDFKEDLEDDEENYYDRRCIESDMAHKAWGKVLDWLNYRDEHYMFLMKADVPFPKEFLNLDEEYYATNLCYRNFLQLKNEAKCLTSNAKELLKPVIALIEARYLLSGEESARGEMTSEEA